MIIYITILRKEKSKMKLKITYCESKYLLQSAFSYIRLILFCQTQSYVILSKTKRKPQPTMYEGKKKVWNITLFTRTGKYESHHVLPSGLTTFQRVWDIYCQHTRKYCFGSIQSIHIEVLRNFLFYSQRIEPRKCSNYKFGFRTSIS